MFKKVITLFFLCTFINAAQNSEEINKKFDEAVVDFKLGKWTTALKSFSIIANEYTLNSKTSLALLFAGKASLKLQNYSDAQENLLRMLNKFPKSKYADDANITLSKLYYDQKQYPLSFEKLSIVIVNAVDNASMEYAKNLAEKIAIKHLSAEEIRSNYESTKLSSVKPFLLFLTGKIYLEQKDILKSRENFLSVIKSYPNSAEAVAAQKLLESLQKNSDAKPVGDVVGVVLPISGSLSSSTTVMEILDGIKYSLSEYNKVHDRKIALLIRDSELQTKKMEEIKNEFKTLENLKCIIGPMFSSEVKDALQVFKSMDIPIISPTATEDYLTEIHPNFFQANPSFIARGKLMAQYIYYVENKRKIAIINAVDGYSPILSSSFSQEFERLGGNIILRESYKSGSVHLIQQINELASELHQIEGLYVPLADKIDIPAIISFLSQSNLDLPIYGDQDWMTTTGLESAPFLDNKLTFCSDYFINFNDLEYQNFSKNYFSKTKNDINRNVLYGYDTMKFLLNIMRNSFSGSDAIKQKMISGFSSVGFHNNICFNSNRINLFLNIIRYSKGKFELIDKFKLNN